MKTDEIMALHFDAAQKMQEANDGRAFIGTADEANDALRSAIEAALKEREGVTTDDVVSGALFDFMGYLTTREERLTLSACDEAGPAVEAIQAFADKRGLSLDEAKVEGWKAHTEPPKAQPMSDEQIHNAWYARDCIAAIQAGDLMAQIVTIVRAAERYHGIGE